ncbi:MAG: dTMP kinase [Actinobacteria bacterium]|nr:dTMP kinase [Actinomycetota bacterium]
MQPVPSAPRRRGFFVAFEGGEGVGKSTQIGRLGAWLRGQGREVVETREPGGTPLGQELRRLVLDPDGHVTPRAETLIYAADRAHHVDTVIRPALDVGAVVLTDRYVDSTHAYQGVGRQLEGAELITDWATGGLRPDLTVLLDLAPAVGLGRAGARSSPDRLESASLAFHEAVRRAFLDLAAADPARYVVVDAGRSVEEIEGEVRVAVAARLADLSTSRDMAP